MSVRRDQIPDSVEKAVECLREQAVQGHLRDDACTKENCQYRLVETTRVGTSVESKAQGDCVLQLQLRARNVERFRREEWVGVVGMEWS